VLDLIKPLSETKRNQVKELACIPMRAFFIPAISNQHQ
jgi:hypothetical protein